MIGEHGTDMSQPIRQNIYKLYWVLWIDQIKYNLFFLLHSHFKQLTIISRDRRWTWTVHSTAQTFILLSPIWFHETACAITLLPTLSPYRIFVEWFSHFFSLPCSCARSCLDLDELGAICALVNTQFSGFNYKRWCDARWMFAVKNWYIIAFVCVFENPLAGLHFSPPN